MNTRKVTFYLRGENGFITRDELLAIISDAGYKVEHELRYSPVYDDVVITIYIDGVSMLDIENNAYDPNLNGEELSADMKTRSIEDILALLTKEIDEENYLLISESDVDEKDIVFYGSLGEPRFTVSFDLF